MKSHTGNFDSTVAFAGAHILAYRQSSSCAALGYGAEIPRHMGPN